MPQSESANLRHGEHPVTMPQHQPPGAICAGSYTWHGRLPDQRPSCANGHRNKLMRYRIRSQTWICDRCHAQMTDAENRQRPVNVRQEYRFLAGSAQEFAYSAIYGYGRQESHRRVYNDLALANDMQAAADAYHREQVDALGAEPYRNVSAIIAAADLN